jgi:hypothetical protein
MSKISGFFSSRDDLMHQRDDLMHQRDDLMRQRDDLMHQRDDLIRQRDGLLAARPQDPVPAILLNTLPKSASVFILETLATTLDKPVVTISPGYFPRDQIDFRQLGVLIGSRAIAQSHLDASAFNQRYLKKIDKVVVQFRDPRQATLSWLHHLERLHKEAQYDLLFTVTPSLPNDYFTLDFAKKIDYQLVNYLPCVIEWQMGWTRFVADCHEPERFMLNTYEAFVADPAHYFASIFTFLGCRAPESLCVHQVTPTMEKNFRKGTTDEWREVFSQGQKTLATEAIPHSLQASFGWR